LARKSRDIMFLADTCITHGRPHQLNLILNLAGLHETSSSNSIISSAAPPLLHRAALLPVFNPSVLCTVRVPRLSSLYFCNILRMSSPTTTMLTLQMIQASALHYKPHNALAVTQLHKSELQIRNRKTPNEPGPTPPPGNTALTRVSATGAHKAALFLIDILRCDPCQCNHRGESALHVACANGHVELVDILAGRAPDMLRAVDDKGCEITHNSINNNNCICIYAYTCIYMYISMYMYKHI
jgi:Ankyrin repeats (many copies)